jgi:hypothetical protein
MRTPPTFVAYRVTTVLAAALILVIFGAGLGGLGPLGELHGLTHQAIDWYRTITGVQL